MKLATLTHAEPLKCATSFDQVQQVNKSNAHLLHHEDSDDMNDQGQQAEEPKNNVLKCDVVGGAEGHYTQCMLYAQ